MLPDRDLLDHLTQCFDEDEIKTLIRVSDASEPQTPDSAAVQVVHRPSGIEVYCAEHTTQIRNKTVALARLLDLLLEAKHRQLADGRPA